MTPRPNDSTARPLLRCRYARLTRTDGREGAASSPCSGRLSLGRRRRLSSGVRTDRTPRLVSSPRRTRVRGFGRSDTGVKGVTTHQLIDTLRENLKKARLDGLVAVGRGRPSDSQLGSRFSSSRLRSTRFNPQNPRSRMTKSTERSHEQNPFDSRRTNRVSLITPRNPPAPAAAAQPLGQAGKDDTDQPAPSPAGD